MVATHPIESYEPPEVREVLRKIAAYEHVTVADVALLRAHLTPAEIERAEGGWGITLDQLLVPPVEPWEAPFDDEPETPEEAAAVAEARAELARGAKTMTTDELLHSLGL